MMTVIIIDDEEKGRQTLQNMLENFCEQVNVVGLAASVPEGVKLIQKMKPDIVFLDIEMPVHNGFELFEFLPDLEAEVIFTTAYDQYAIKAFKFSAVDYLLKPIDLEELRDAISRARKKNGEVETDKFEVLVDNIRKPFEKLGLPTLEGYSFVKLSNIVYCEADSNYTRFHMANKEKILVPKTLKEYDALLSGANFLRVHRSFLVNLDHIVKYTKTRQPSLTLTGGNVVAVSVQRKEVVLGRLATS